VQRRTFLVGAVAVCLAAPLRGAEAFPVSIRVNAAAIQGEMRPIWAWFGYDEPNYTYMKDGRKLLSQLAAQLALLTSPEWVRPSAGTVRLRFPLPRQGVSRIQFTW